jgi:hypothetical protein
LGEDTVKNPQTIHPKSTIWRSRVALATGLFFSLGALAPYASARPETIRAGISYYSDELVETRSIRDIGVERNYEEVYQFYSYYEVFYDESERVTRFLEYKRGDVIREDLYRYKSDGSLQEHFVKKAGEPEKSLPIQSQK